MLQPRILDDDNDGVANEDDLCPNTATAGALVDLDGCALSQKDSRQRRLQRLSGRLPYRCQPVLRHGWRRLW